MSDGARVAPQRLDIPAGLSAAETHAHTTASDGMVTGPALVRAAAAIGLSVVCITDHDVMPPLDEAQHAGADLGVDVVRGQEVTAKFPPGLHVIALFHERPVRMGMSLEDTVQAIHDLGGLAILAHPFMPTWFASITERRTNELLETQSVDGIELRHTAPVLAGTWARLDRFYAANRERLGGVIGAGDSHFGIRDIGRLVTLFPGSGAADLRRAIVERTTSPARGVVPEPPTWKHRLKQQRRSMLWLNYERRNGRVGSGEGPRDA